jgi:hypothetical protein
MQVMIFRHEVRERSTDGQAIDVEEGRFWGWAVVEYRRLLSGRLGWSSSFASRVRIRLVMS